MKPEEVIQSLYASLQEETETSDIHPMERLEELRRTLKGIMRPDVLQSLLELSKALEKGPEQYHFFLLNSVDGKDCKYAVATIENFKKKRLDRVKLLLRECLDKIEDV